MAVLQQQLWKFNTTTQTPRVHLCTVSSTIDAHNNNVSVPFQLWKPLHHEPATRWQHHSLASNIAAGVQFRVHHASSRQSSFLFAAKV
ncbi:hypothetical protein DEO72_LG2g2762 [Vigna unguiculata]|uniref:Uncharacterized protein n=1 Tax=Vigna unguiculata TaxID=3917 RepID=A0A4D6L1T6_VIGUN|nr:hypothetical protein DEO72_LG2g2762 [Vigna unguiculata]